MSTTHFLSCDIETFSDVDLKKAGLYKYAQSPKFDILLIAWVKDDRQTVRCLDVSHGVTEAGADDYDELLSELYNPDVELRAYNAAFEHYCINVWLKRQGKKPIPLSRWRCTMAHGLYCGYTAGLGATGEAMGLPQDKKKLGIGLALIRKFCVPQKDGRRIMPEDEPEKWELFKTYCRQDVVTEREIKRRLSAWPMPEREQKLWEITTEANIIGVGIDRKLVYAAIGIGEMEQEELLAEAKEISGLKNPKSVQQLMKWLNEELDTDEENEITDLKKATVAEMLQTGVESPLAARMLELRQLMSKTSTKKYDALQAAVCDDGRVRGMMFYYGANRTGRWAGRIVQPQNLPQNHLEALDLARNYAKDADTEKLKLCWGSLPDTLSQLIRTAFIPSPGKIYAVADYSAIEARVVAWLAGEEWVLDAFRAGKDIYCETASQMFGVPVEKHGQNAHLRQRGKVATLALGYGGGEGALTAMGALKMGIPEEDLPDIKARWRQANPAICGLWRRVEDAAFRAVRSHKKQVVHIKEHDPARARENEERMGAEEGEFSEYFLTGTDIIFGFESDKATEQEFMTIELPTGRKLFYAHPFLAPAKNFPERESLHYYSVNQANKNWGVTDTWGGKLVENITQAIARDCLAETLIRLREKGLIAAFHVHDEVIVEVDREEQLDEVLGIMAEPLSWAPGLPLRGAGFCAEYYQKD